MKKSLVVIACMAALVVLFTVQSASAQGKLEGIWKKTEVTIAGPNAQKILHPQPNVCIFAKKYYSLTEVEGEKPRPDQPLEKATDAQKVAAWEPFSAEAGTYEVKGTTITFHVVVSKDPESMKPGTFYTGDFKIEGNTLIVTVKADNTGPMTEQFTMKFVRVE